jgi:hypothetical protein
LLTSDSDDECLLILTLAYISLFKILHNLISLETPVYAVQCIFPFYTHWHTCVLFEPINGELHLYFVSSICLKVKICSTVIFPRESFFGILILFPQHNVLILHIKYLLEFVCCTVHSSETTLQQSHIIASPFLRIGHTMSGFHSCDTISSSRIFAVSSEMILSPFPPSFINSAGIWSYQVAFHFLIYLLPYLCLHNLVIQHMVLRFLHCPLFTTGIVHSILQFKVLLIIFR